MRKAKMKYITIFLCCFLGSVLCLPTDPISRNFGTQNDNPNVKVFSTYPTSAPIKGQDSHNDLSKGTNIAKDVNTEETEIKGETIAKNDAQEVEKETEEGSSMLPQNDDQHSMSEMTAMEPQMSTGVALPPFDDSLPPFSLTDMVSEEGDDDMMRPQMQPSDSVPLEGEVDEFFVGIPQTETEEFPEMEGLDGEGLDGEVPDYYATDDDIDIDPVQVILPVGIVPDEEPIADMTNHGRPLNLDFSMMKNPMDPMPIDMPLAMAEKMVNPDFQPIAEMDETFSLPRDPPAVEMNDPESSPVINEHMGIMQPAVSIPEDEMMVPLVEVEVPIEGDLVNTDEESEVTEIVPLIGATNNEDLIPTLGSTSNNQDEIEQDLEPETVNNDDQFTPTEDEPINKDQVVQDTMKDEMPPKFEGIPKNLEKKTSAPEIDIEANAREMEESINEAPTEAPIDEMSQSEMNEATTPVSSDMIPETKILEEVTEMSGKEILSEIPEGDTIVEVAADLPVVETTGEITSANPDVELQGSKTVHEMMDKEDPTNKLTNNTENEMNRADVVTEMLEESATLSDDKISNTMTELPLTLSTELDNLVEEDPSINETN